jgi:hypothetical protein
MLELPYEMKLDQVIRQNLLLAWLFSTCVFAISGALILGVPKYYRLTVRGVATEGKIIELQPTNHQSVIYSYPVDSTVLSGGGHAGDVDSQFNQLRLGQRVLVFYDPYDVSASCLGDPNKHLKSLILGTVFIGLAPSLAIGWLVIKRAHLVMKNRF